MISSARATDLIMGVCSHGLPCCPHTVTGMIIMGSPKVQYDGLPAARFGDMVITTCPHCGGVGSICLGGAQKNLIDGIPAHRLGDSYVGPFGNGIIITGSPKCFDG